MYVKCYPLALLYVVIYIDKVHKGLLRGALYDSESEEVRSQSHQSSSNKN